MSEGLRKDVRIKNRLYKNKLKEKSFFFYDMFYLTVTIY